MNKNYQPAILFLVTLLVEEGNTSKAIQLLRKLAAVRPSPEIYSKIGDIYAERQERKEAIECYTEAIQYVQNCVNHWVFVIKRIFLQYFHCRLDPLNRRAISQLEALEKKTSPHDDEAGPSNASNNEDEDSEMDVQTDATDAGGEERLPSISEDFESLWSGTAEVLQPYQEWNPSESIIVW